jgi:hypothetical protein
MWLWLVSFNLVLFICWNLSCTIANLRIKCVSETKNVSVLFYKNLKSSFSTWLTHLTQKFLYILGCSGPECAAAAVLRTEMSQKTVQELVLVRVEKFLQFHFIMKYKQLRYYIKMTWNLLRWLRFCWVFCWVCKWLVESLLNVVKS